MRTLNILIVDDEAFVVDWLISILDAECNLSLNLFSCYGVNEAWRIIGENRIDILVTDIQMPDGSGLDLASNIRRHWADCKVLMLTAYSEFEYAQRAIQSGVDGYILKTEKDSYIINEVRRVIDELNEMLDERQRNLSVQRDLDQYRHHYRSAVLTHWLRGHYSAAEHLEKCMTDLGLNPSLPVYLVLGRIHSPAGENSELSALHVRLSGLCILAESSENALSEFCGSDVCFLIQPKDSYLQNYQSQLESLFEIVSSSCSNLYDLTVSFAISCAASDAAGVPGLFRQLGGILRSVAVESESFIYRLPADFAPARSHPSGFSASVQDILEALEKKGAETFDGILKRMEASLSSAHSVQDPAFQNAYFCVSVALMDYIFQRPEDSFGDLSLIYTPAAHSGVVGAFEYLRDLGARIFSEQNSPALNDKQLLIAKIDAYISENAHHDIALSDLSRHFNYNAGYLSRLYSNATGMTLKATIVKHRLRYVEHLMKDENLSLNDILERSGFKSRSYFNFFIKHTLGVTPSQYRQSLLSVKK